MYSFEGQFRRGPVQSLGGSSRKEPLGSLIQRTHDERKKREMHKLRFSSAMKIQSFYRSYRVRIALKSVLRVEYDQLWHQVQKSSLSSHSLCELCRRLVFFYNEDLDTKRLIELSQSIIKQKKDALAYFYDRYSNFHQLKGILLICCDHLMVIAASASPAAIPLRMLETFTSIDAFKSVAQLLQKKTMFHALFKFLVQKGYFYCMRILLDNRIPSDLEKTISPPTPLAGSIYDLVMNPVLCFELDMDNDTKHHILQSLCSEMFCKAFSPQVHKFLLPALSASQREFPVIAFIHALVPHSGRDIGRPLDKADAGAHWELTVEPTVWLLSSLLALCEKQLDKTSENDFHLYLLLLYKLVPTLKSVQSSIQDDSFSDSDEEPMEFDDTPGSLGEVQQECLQYLDDPLHVMRIVSSIGKEPSQEILVAIATVCYALIVQNKMSVHNTRLLYSLAFNPVFVRQLWHACVTVSTTTATKSDTKLLQLLSSGLPMSEDNLDRIVPLLFLFSSLFSHSLHSLHDSDFFQEDPGSRSVQPFGIKELVPMATALRDASLGIVSLAHPESRPNLTEDYKKTFHSVGDVKSNRLMFNIQKHRETLACLFRVMSLLVKQLYARDSRRPFCPLGSWLSPYVTVQADKLDQLYKARDVVFARRPFGSFSVLNPHRDTEDGPSLSNTEVKKLTILTELPFVVSFEERVKIFQKLVQHERLDHQGEMRYLSGGPHINIMVRRNYLYEDAFDKLSPENEPNLKLRTQVQLVNFAGLDEAGIDGGGIFREFMMELLKTAFDPNRGFFKHTNDQLLYPNPQARLIVENFTKHYYFLGRILGKVIFENMLVELPFASFFLSKILSRHRGDVDINHLASLDPEMYRNLLFLKTYEGDVTDLGLDFTVVNNDLGEAQVEDLKPGGKDIVVNNMNRIEYIHLMADYRLNKQIRAHCNAFRQGLADVVNIDWLRMFDHNELQVLISGAQVPIDIDDLKQHTNYSGVYTAEHKVIKDFWAVVENFTDKQKRQLLKFVTSCSRPPLLGFKELYPAFCIHYAGQEDRLPSASTCMNLLKLPEYPDKDTLKQKLVYAVESGAGFELS